MDDETAIVKVLTNLAGGDPWKAYIVIQVGCCDCRSPSADKEAGGETKVRNIGHVVWASPVSPSTTPWCTAIRSSEGCLCHQAQRKDVLAEFQRECAQVHADLSSQRHLIFHIPGPQIDTNKFARLMPYPRIGLPSNFDYPVERLLEFRDILSAEEIRTLNNQDRSGDPMRYTIECGLITLSMIGYSIGFVSHFHRYFTLGSRDLMEATICPDDNDSSPFSRSGDSGSIIVDTLGKFVALTGGTGPSGEEKEHLNGLASGTGRTARYAASLRYLIFNNILY